MGEVYVVLICDRHTDEEVHLFSDKKDAIEFAVDAALGCTDGDRDQLGDNEWGLTPSMREAGWLYYATYSCEGDTVRVEACAVDSSL